MDGGAEVKDSEGALLASTSLSVLLLSHLQLEVSQPHHEKYFIFTGLPDTVDFLANMICAGGWRKSQWKK